MQLLCSNLVERPDKHSALGIHASKTGYVLFRVDSLQLNWTEIIEWTNLSPLVKYVQELYSTPYDPSMVFRAKFWTVQFNSTQYDAYPIFASEPPGRRTWVAIAEDPNCPGRLVIIKDVWRDKDRICLEGDLIQEVHTRGIVPGVVQCLASGDVEGCPPQASTSTEGNVEKRQKYRIVLGQVGLPLSACSSTLEFLKVFVDAVQVHRKCVKNGVLHRDFGWANILMNPRDEKYGGNWDKSVEMMSFIDAVIEGDETSGRGPRCLITDFDCASKWMLLEELRDPLEREAQTKNLLQRTGSPTFISAELSSFKITLVGYRNISFEHFDKLLYMVQPHVKAYAKRYGVGAGYRFQKHLKQVAKWIDNPSTMYPAKNHTHLDAKDPEKPTFLRIPHTPCHDIESLFWTLAWRCVRSQPPPRYQNAETDKIGHELEDVDCRDSLSSYSQFCATMLRHVGGSCTDHRVGFRKQEPYDWEEALHPALRDKGIGIMLSAMGQYLALPWKYFPGGAYDEHAHDMATLVLLNVIVPLIPPGQDIVLSKQPRELPKLVRRRLGIEIDDIRSLEMRQSTTEQTTSPFRESGSSASVNDHTTNFIESWRQILRNDLLWFL